jgi:general secretion pathway protein J
VIIRNHVEDAGGREMRWSTRPPSRVAGFTLVEALIAIAMMSAILAVLATITSQWLPNWNRGFARVQRLEALAFGLERIVADLAAAQHVSAGRAFSQPIFDGDLLSVTFVRPSFGPDDIPSLDVIRIGEDVDRQGRIVVRRRTPFVPVTPGVNDRDQPNFVDPVVLVREPYRLSFSYAGPDRIWKDTWHNLDTLPRAVRLLLRDAATDRPLSLSTAVMVHADLPAKCVTPMELAECFAAPRANAQATGRAPSGGNVPTVVPR